jgi:hypothetical protein
MSWLCTAKGRLKDGNWPSQRDMYQVAKSGGWVAWTDRWTALAKSGRRRMSNGNWWISKGNWWISKGDG